MVNTVRGFITAKPELGESDIDLIWAIWAWQLSKAKPALKIENMSARELMKHWKEGSVSSAFNISRSRRKCQQHYPETRGETYGKRQEHQVTIRADVKKATDQAIGTNNN